MADISNREIDRTRRQYEAEQDFKGGAKMNGTDIATVNDALTADSNETITGDWTFSGRIEDGNGNLLYDPTAFHIPLERLQASSLTVAGNSVSLGGSTAIASTDLSDSASIAADTVDGYDIQKDGTDGTGVINFKTV